MVETNTDIERLFNTLDSTTEILKEALDVTYLEALAESGECLFHGEIDLPIEMEKKAEVKRKLTEINIEHLQSENIRKAFQLAVLKGMKEGVQPHHVLTPDSVVLFISYLVNKLVGEQHDITMVDPAAGVANLLTGIINHSKSNVNGIGFEVDETLIKLAYVNANLQRNELELYHQDSIKPLKLTPVDMVVSDLPIGYYPNEEVASLYELHNKKGKSLVHHLLMEQSLNWTRDGGYLLFLVPNFLFESEEAGALHSFIKEKANILGLLQLPPSMFKSADYGKSIFILQKKGEHTKPPRHALLAELPSFSRKEALADMINRINDWMRVELGK